MQSLPPDFCSFSGDRILVDVETWGLAVSCHVAVLWPKNWPEYLVSFFKIRHLIPFDTIKLLYHAIFSPFLYYGIVVWGVASECFMNPVSVQQKKVIRAITFKDSFSPSEPLFLKLGLLKLDDIFMLQLASFVYACINRLAPPVFDNYFNYISNIQDHSTRH